ncbi:MAG TPA: hypothetical protein VGN23_07615 [Verrucomicrobiae bacterium]|jgi:hypothetical protein
MSCPRPARAVLPIFLLVKSFARLFADFFRISTTRWLCPAKFPAFIEPNPCALPAQTPRAPQEPAQFAGHPRWNRQLCDRAIPLSATLK